MVQTCRKCSRLNPAEASFCYHDGMALPGREGEGGSVSVSAQSFPSPFVFPSGRRCGTFDELAMACWEEWTVAQDLLQQGFFESFLGGLGRTDLAQAAQLSLRFPDRERGLDRLLGELPTDVLLPARLFVEPQDVHLGILQVAEDRSFQLHLENRGLRLLYGSVTCDGCDWLVLGESPGAAEKLFQFRSETHILVQVKGKRLRASNRPLEGRLFLESNGGMASVTVRAEVPVKPFTEGILRGALTPRQVAEKAKTTPKEAAVYFENGTVAQWYQDNGWTYPVQGPAASGLGAVQQFFEALGLTPPPKVDISERSVALTGNRGDSLEHLLEVKSQEKRPVYAHAASDQSWLEVGPVQLNGRIAVIPLRVPVVPEGAGETLTAKILVQANGNQRFLVPVTLTVEESLRFDVPRRTDEDSATPNRQRSPASPRSRASGAGCFWASKLSGAVRKYVSLSSLLYLIPLLLLGLILAGILVNVIGWLRTSEGPPNVVEEKPRLGIQFHEERMTFGLTLLQEQDPEHPDRFKRLTFDEAGRTNNTRVRIDGFDYLLGQKHVGHWLGGRKMVKLQDNRGWESVFEFDTEKVRVTQTVQLVQGPQSPFVDTALVAYALDNRSSQTHKVGLRIMLDTYIGSADGVPFTIPGQPGLMRDRRLLAGKDIPDYIQASGESRPGPSRNGGPPGSEASRPGTHRPCVDCRLARQQGYRMGMGTPGDERKPSEKEFFGDALLGRAGNESGREAGDGIYLWGESFVGRRGE